MPNPCKDSITITNVSSCLNIGDNNSELMNYDTQSDSDTNQNEFQPLTIKDKIMRAVAVLDSTTGCTFEELQKYLDIMYLYNNMHSSALKKYLQQSFSDGSIIQVTGEGIHGNFRIAPELRLKITKAVGISSFSSISKYAISNLSQLKYVKKKNATKSIDNTTKCPNIKLEKTSK